ncbi:MAG: MBL fold metallo-hydrolase [Gammaproteobacteria bacterium]|nr:MBL fold metallo-hydrolase [Gammaproteobacteria bacterium]
MESSSTRAVITPFFHAGSSTWTYLVADPASASALVIDPVLDFDAASGRTGTVSAQAVLDAARAQGCKLEWILETHAHADHLSAGAWLRSVVPGARIGIGEGIRSVQQTFRSVFNLGEGFAVDGSQFDHLFRDGERLEVGGLGVEVIATPGHTSDSVSYLIGEALFVGDSLFMPDGGTARCDFPGGSAATLYASIRRLYQLPDATRVFVCHDYGPGGRAVASQTSIGAEKSSNIHLTAQTSQADFVALREARDATLSMPALILPSVQVNIRAGRFPEPEPNGVRYLKLPLDSL